MKQILFILMLCLVITAHAQQQGTKKALIPAGWTIYHGVAGDLNKDSLVDVAIIVESPNENEEGEKPRSLLLLTKNNKKDDTYTLACQNDQVILGGQSGGTMGDPFSGMEIKRGVLKVDFFGGSREKWSITHRYRYDKGSFYVIGATFKMEDGPLSETYDYNVANGNVIITTRDLENKANNKTVNRVQKITAPELGRFEPDALWALLNVPGYTAKVANCKIIGAGNGDCFHLEFDCGEFVNAETYLDIESLKLWYSLTVPAPADDVQPNPAYANTVFEITYLEKTGVKCEPQGPAPYQLVVGFKVKQ
ncbi:MAG: hypothetical protein U0289_04735 [Cyclobacteriaceae bacterium]|nr:hypothetical protein [Cyclobacteriaceae bacterium]